MTTLEDVFWLYERNSKIYLDCSNNNNDNDNQLDTCPSKIHNKCLCYLNYPVYPQVIGDQSLKCSFSRKTYIKFGEECSICLEKIIYKSNAFLSDCGHAFHKSCIFKLFDSVKNNMYNKGTNCALCRRRIMIYGLDEIKNRYKYAPGTLDELENFWLSITFNVPDLCYYGANHYLGFDKNCEKCINYRKTGLIL